MPDPNGKASSNQAELDKKADSPLNAARSGTASTFPKVPDLAPSPQYPQHPQYPQYLQYPQYSQYPQYQQHPQHPPYPPYAWSAAAAARASRQPPEPHAGGPERPEERPAQAERIDWSARYPDEIVLHGPHRKEVALTFDDGPDDEWTPQVLRVLAHYGVKATFFTVGQRCERYPSVLRRIAREGHIVGNHSWNHPNLAKMTKEEVRSQLERTDAAIRKVTGKTPHLFRPPYGALSDIVVQEAIRLHKKIVLWNVDSLDWMQLSAQQVAANVLSHTQPGSIILMHSAGGVGESLQGTVDGLPIVIESLHRLKYSFRTIPQLIGIHA